MPYTKNAYGIKVLRSTLTLKGVRIATEIEARVEGIEIFAVKIVLRNAYSIGKALIMHYLALAQVLYRLLDIGVVDKTQNIVICDASFLLWCNHIRTNFSEIPMNFYGNIPCSGYSLADRYIINQRFHDFAVKVFQVCVLFNEFAAVITNRNFIVDFG